MEMGKLHITMMKNRYTRVASKMIRRMEKEC